MAPKKPAPELVRNVRALFGDDRGQADRRPIKTCLAVRHVAFEDLGLLGPLVSSRGFGVRYHDDGVQPIDAATLLAPDLLIVLGGPIGVYETDAYIRLSSTKLPRSKRGSMPASRRSAFASARR
jgi:hypothetical protein